MVDFLQENQTPVGLTEDHRDAGRRMRVTMANTVTHWILLREVDSVNDCFFSNVTGLETVGLVSAGRFVSGIERILSGRSDNSDETSAPGQD